jgi:putative transposase
MRKTRFTTEQIITILEEHAAGAQAAELTRRHGISRATLYHWKKQYGDLQVSDAKRLKALEDENRRLKRLVADQALNLQILKDVLGKEH